MEEYKKKVEPKTKEEYAAMIREKQVRVVNMQKDQAAIFEFQVPFEAFMTEMGVKSKPNLYSAPFEIGNFVWKVLFTTDEQCLSVFLDNTHVKDAEPGWQCSCIFRFELKGADYGGHSDSYTFMPNKHNDRGYPKFHHLDRVARVLTPGEYNGETYDFFTIRVSVRDTQTQKNQELKEAGLIKQQTGCVGLRNQGATCYLNSFLQTLFHLPAVRAATYRLPGTVANRTSEKKANMAYQLAKLFYKMQTYQEPPRTTELTESFGWTKAEAFEQHDVQELARILLDNLETKMAGTPDEKTIRHLFMGKVRKFVKCRNLDYTSSRIDNFYDIQLQVKGCRYLSKSIEHELKQEELVGDNKYHCVDEDRGIDSKQDADMGLEFLVLPPVLVMHLRRFEYDLNTFQYDKINDCFEFPEHLDMEPYLRTVSGNVTSPAPHAAVGSDCTDDEWDRQLASSADQHYKLHSVLVHSGFMHGGHYHAYIAPGDGKSWYRFNDSVVTKVGKEAAVNDNYGGKHATRFWLEQSHKDTSAYMLVYIKKDRWDEIVNHLPCEIPPGLKQDFTAEDAAEAKIEQETKQAHLYNYYVPLRIPDVKAFVDSETGQLGLLPDGKKMSKSAIRVPKDTECTEDIISDALDSTKVLRMWPTTHSISLKSQQHGYPLPDVSLHSISEGRAKSVTPVFIVPEKPKGTPLENTTLVFIKEYRASQGRLFFKDALYLDPNQFVVDQIDGCEPYLEADRSLVQLPPNALPVEGAIYVVVCVSSPLHSPKGCFDPPPTEEEINKAENRIAMYGIDRSNVFCEGATLVKNCGSEEVHEAVRTLNHPAVRDKPPPPPTVTDYYRLVRVVSAAHFYPLSDTGKKIEGKSITLRVYGAWTPADVVKVLAPKAKWGPSKIRLWSLTQDRADQQFLDGTLSQLMPRMAQSAHNELGYELLDYPLSELEDSNMQELHLAFLSNKLKVVARPKFLIELTATVEEVLCIFRQKLFEKLPLDECPKPEEKLILVKTRNSRIEGVVKTSACFAIEARQCPDDCFRVELEPQPLAIDGVVPTNQIKLWMSLVELRDSVPYFHGAPFFLFVLEESTCQEVIIAARNFLCLRAELRNAKLYSTSGGRVGPRLDPDVKIQSVVADLKHEGRPPSLALETKKRVQYYTEKAIKIHN